MSSFHDLSHIYIVGV